MKFLFVLFVLFFFAVGNCWREDLINEVNLSNSTWIAGLNPRFNGVSRKRIKHMLGVRSNFTFQSNATTTVVSLRTNLPSLFDSRKVWPYCIGPVGDQGECGSCFAFAAAYAMSDRRCIQMDQNFIQLSALDLVACDFKGENMGCLGGIPLPTWTYAVHQGVVSESCMPYSKKNGGPIDICTPEPNCTLSKHDSTPFCGRACVDRTQSYREDKHRLKSAYSIQGIEAMKQELVDGGPVEATFAVYEDFINYRSGIYQHVVGEYMGKHAVKIIGYNSNATVPYWIVQNSWGKEWGDRGMFNIAMHECFIESEVTSGKWK
eukprot:g584.t1